MYYTIYKTTNKINGKIYIGKHKTLNPNDSYFGSGVAINKAIKKYGKENFSKEILFIFDNEEEMNSKEKEIITSDFIKENNYNQTVGGKGSWAHVDQSGNNNPMRNENVKRKVISSGKNTRAKNKNFYDSISRKNLKAAIEKNTGRKRPNHSVFMKKHMKEYWEENREDFRNSLSSTFKLISPDGVEYITNRLEDFAKEHNLAYTTLCTNSDGRIPIKGKNKGWCCLKIANKGKSHG